jgi:hypothetical protein
MNRRVAGQILRYVGLVVEMLGILAVALSSRQENGRPAAAGLSSRQIWIIVGTGFLLWLVGTVLTYWPGNGRTGRMRASVGKHDLEL